MPKYKVFVQTVASATVEVDVPEGMTDPNEISELAFNQAEFPSLSANASGWGRSWSLDLGEWEDVTEDGTPVVELAEDEV
jgi:hypothetical protein